jgi:hypothetical protein
MIAPVRDVLKRQLPPPVFNKVKSEWWFYRHFLPRLAKSYFLSRTPKVRTFPQGTTSELAERISRVNAAAPTAMCRVMTNHGSDKGRGWHNYTTIYTALFGSLRKEPLRILELGIGTNNPRLVSTMGADGRPGASLRGWRELFPNALVYGADIDRDILFKEDRIETFFCDQLDSTAIHALWAQPVFRGGMDIIIDDGLHTFEGNVSFLESSLEYLKPGGVYIVEDILETAIVDWNPWLETFSKRFPDHEFAFVELPNPANIWDNNLLIIHRRR